MKFEKVGNELIISIGNNTYTQAYDEAFGEGVHQLSIEWIPEIIQNSFFGEEDFDEATSNIHTIFLNALEDGVDFTEFIRHYVFFLSWYFHIAMNAYSLDEDGNHTDKIFQTTKPFSSYVTYDHAELTQQVPDESQQTLLHHTTEIMKRYVDLQLFGHNYPQTNQGKAFNKSLITELKSHVNELLAEDPTNEFGHTMQASFIAKLTDNTSDKFYHHMTYISTTMKQMLLREIWVPHFFPELKAFSYESSFDQNYISTSSALYDSLTEKNKELEKQEEIKNKMVKQYANTWTNLLFPNWVFEVAKSLIDLSRQDKTNIKDRIQTLMQVYRSEVTLQEECKMLEMTHSGHVDAFKQYIQKGINQPAKENAIPMDQLAATSLARVLNRIFADQRNQRIMKIRDDLKAHGYNLATMENSFYDVILKDEQKVINWFRDQLYSFDLIFKGEAWRQFTVGEESGASAFFSGLFSELFLNAITYGQKDTNSYIRVELGEQTLNDVTYLKLTMTNDTAKPIGSHRGGLKGWHEKLQMMNSLQEEPDQQKYVTQHIRHAEHTVELFIRKDQLIKWG